MAQKVGNLTAMQETMPRLLSLEDCLEENVVIPFIIFLPGEFHEQRSLASYSLQDRKELDTTEWPTLSLCNNCKWKVAF